MKRKLPTWMTESRPKTLVFLPHAKYLRDTLEYAKLAIEILLLPREVRCGMYGENKNEDFHFFNNSAVNSVADVEDVVEIILATKGESFFEELECWDDAAQVAGELAICVHIFELQYATMFHYLDNPSKYLILSSTNIPK